MSGGGSVFEATGAQSQMETALGKGLDTLDLNQTVTFVLYKRVVLPLDGFVFWVRATLLNPGALPNGFSANSATPNQPQLNQAPAPEFQARGSLHHTTVNLQDPDESYSQHRMIFTSRDEVNNLADIQPDHLYMALTDGQRYAFSTRSMWYRQAGLYHYSGDAVYPTMATQVVDDPAQLNVRELVVSNSLSVWLGLNKYFPIYPSVLVPDNIRPPYASVHIGEDDTAPLQSAPWFDRNGTRWQLAEDNVRVTFYGVRNDTIMDWLDYVTDYTFRNPETLGIMNIPIPRDSKRGQVEISALAQKKVVTFRANYYQSRMRDVARRLITSALIDQFIADAPLAAA